MKCKSQVIKTTKEHSWMREYILVECRDFSFEIPLGLAKNYPIGRLVEIKVTPK